MSPPATYHLSGYHLPLCLPVLEERETAGCINIKSRYKKDMIIEITKKTKKKESNRIRYAKTIK
jgi:hypothetical protein